MSTYHFAIVCLLLGHLKRSNETNPCSKSTPCGWEIYKTTPDNIDYFMKSPCECPSNTICRRRSQDISLSAFVHMCQLDNEDVNSVSLN